jgi:FkbM family methyltransferase
MNKLADVCRELLSTPIVVLDIGADGGCEEIKNLAILCSVHAFEPRHESYLKLMAADDRRYASLTHHNVGLARTAGKHRLYVTRIPQASSLLRPNQAIISRWRDDDAFDVVEESDVNCVTLREFSISAGINSVDLIKIDTQGSELDILLSGSDLLPNVSVIKTEVEFVRLYEKQNLFDDIVRELSTFGFRFIDFGDMVTLGGRHPKKIWADALFLRDVPDMARETVIKAAAVLIEHGYVEDAVWFMLDHGVEPVVVRRLSDAAVADADPRAGRLLRVVRKLQAWNIERAAAGKKPIRFSPFRRLLSKFSFGRKVLATLSAGVVKK